jgi:hypothetical protein
VTIWIAVLVLVLCVAGGIALVVVRGIALWRQFKRTGRTLGSELSRISSASAEIEGQLQRAADATERLRAAQERLAVSRAKLDVQRAALAEAQAQISRILWFMPER